jgi:hypothetical protein
MSTCAILPPSAQDLSRAPLASGECRPPRNLVYWAPDAPPHLDPNRPPPLNPNAWGGELDTSQVNRIPRFRQAF